MHDEQLLEFSNLSQEIADGDKSITVEIYRIVGQSDWQLEVVDEYSNSTVWGRTFIKDSDALNEAQMLIEQEGIESFVGPEGGENREGWL